MRILLSATTALMLTALATTTAQAQFYTRGDVYFGAIDQSVNLRNNDDIDVEVNGAGFGVRAGYNFNDRFGTELRLGWLTGDEKFTQTINGTTYSGEMNAGFQADVLGRVNFGLENGMVPYLSGGLTGNAASVDYSAGGGALTGDSTAFIMTIGLGGGLEYNTESMTFGADALLGLAGSAKVGVTAGFNF